MSLRSALVGGAGVQCGTEGKEIAGIPARLEKETLDIKGL